MRRFRFLHIGKTGGTALRPLFEEQCRRHPGTDIKLLPHRHGLPDILREDPLAGVGFFVRDPLKRLISGFNSRLRMGQPRYNVPWSPDEASAFARFGTPSLLGEGIVAENPELRRAAQDAMQAIQHIRMGYRHYLHSVEMLEQAKARIVFIGDQARFLRDIAWLKRRIGIDADIDPPLDDIGAHRNPSHLTSALSPRAEMALRACLADDYAIYAWCLAHRERLAAAEAARGD